MTRRIDDSKPDESLLLVQGFLRRTVARLVRIDPERIDADQTLTAYGLDSLAMAELQAAIEEELGVSASMVDLLEGISLREAARRLSGMAAAGDERPPSAPEPVSGGAELSSGQRSLWLLHRLAPESAAYHLAGAARVLDGPGTAALRRAFQALFGRHAALRTIYVDAPGGPAPRVMEEVELAFLCADASGWNGAELERRVREEAFRPFDLARGPLFRTALFEGAAGGDVLVVAIHHIAADFASFGILAQELGVLTAGGTLAAPALPSAEALQGQAAHLGGRCGEALFGWWRERLTGAPPLDLPTDRPRPPVQTFAGGGRTAFLEMAPIAGLARSRAATPFMALVAGFSALLARTSGQEDFLVGVPTSGRSGAGLGKRLSATVGYLVNPVALRADLANDPTGGDLVERARRTTLEALAHQEYPFALLAERLQPERGAGRPPLVQTMLVMERAPVPELQGLGAFALGLGGVRLRMGGLELESLPLESPGAQLDLTLFVAELDQRLAVSLNFNRDLFDPATAERLLAHFTNLLLGIAATPERPVWELDLLSEAERRQLAIWNATGSEHGAGETCLHALFEQQAQRTPRTPAILGGGRAVSYRELNRQANRLAHHLRRLGVAPEDRVGVLLNRTPDLLVGLLGVLKAGGAYVPLDPAYPRERLHLMAEDAGIAVLVTEELLAGLMSLPGLRRVRLDGDREVLSMEADHDLAPVTGPRNLAYIIYTSGSTGRPKGVAIEHRSPVERVRWARRTFSDGELAGVLAATSVCFDLSVFELFAPLAWGGRVILASNALALPSLAEAEEVTLVNTVPSAMAELAAGPLPPRLAVVNLAGEALASRLVEQIHRHGQVRRVLNLYGPSEDTTYSTWAEIEPGEERITIGRPLVGTRVHLLDRRLNPVAVGVPGELCLAGAGLARGYLGRPDLTAERFLPDPAGGPGERLYLTGDLGRRLVDGRVEFLGRRDHQVKIRGFRVEPGEIEMALASHPAVRETVAIAREDLPGGRGLVAYAAVGGGRPAPGELRAFLAGRLPAHMVPEHIVLLAALPRTSNGKVDRKSLPGPIASPPAAFAPPRTPVEELVAEVWADLLGRERVGVHDDFFSLGGHSLLAARVVARLRAPLEVDLPLDTLFRHPTVADLAAAIERARRSDRAALLPPLERNARRDALPLSFAQERLWFLERLAPGRAVYNIPVALRLSGTLDPGALERGLTGIVRRHEVLRTRYGATSDGAPFQTVLEPMAVAVPMVDLSGLPRPAAEAVALDLAGAEARRPFDLESGPVLRCGLVRLSPVEHLLLLTLHHIACDGASLRVLAGELAAGYSAALGGTSADLVTLPVQYADYASWQRRALCGPALELGLAGWRERLSGAPDALSLPTDHPRPAEQGFRGSVEPAVLGAERVRSLRELARGQGATLFMALLAGWSALLARLAGQSDLVVGTAVANRTRREVEGLLGLFVNSLPLRLGIPAEAGFAEVVARARESALGAYGQSEVPFERLVEDLAPQRDLSRSPLFQVMLVLQEDPAGAFCLPGVVMRPVAVHSGTSKFDLTLSLVEGEAGLWGSLEFDSDLFEGATARRLLGQFEMLLAAAVAEPSLPVGDLALQSAAERRQVLEVWGRGEAPVGSWDVGLHELFEAQAGRSPEATALVWGEQRWSYRELDRQAEILAGRLRRLGVGPEVRVGILTERRPEMVAALLGTLKAGGAYLPLDPAYPRERLAFLLADGQAPVVLAQRSLAGLLPADVGRVAWLGGEGEGEGASSAALPSVRGFCHPEQLAYVIYTSGSTGIPKGVGIRHGSAVARLAWALASYGDRLSGVLAATSICFDLSVFELFAPLAWGGTVILAENALSLPGLAAAGTARLLNTVPSALSELVRAGGVPESVRVVNLAGEPLRRELVNRLYELPWIEAVYNLYGPSEDTTYSTGCLVGREESVEPSIGRPLPGGRVVVLDGRRQPSAPGAVGELWLGGAGLARGYLGRPELTAERFRPDPFGQEPGGRLYGTGDRVRWRADGSLEFLGRLDHQVKVRGYRLELGEVETVVGRHPGVTETAVVVREDLPGGRGLVAYVASAAALADAELRSWLRERLPEPMVPQAFVWLVALPRTPNGKVDRQALPRPAGFTGESGYQAPRDPVEEAVAEVWSDLLGRERIGVHEDFFAVGGHSLLAIQVVSRLRQALGVDLPVRALFESRTVADLAAAIERARRSDRAALLPPLVPVPRNGDLPLSFAQTREWLLDQLEPGTPAYNIAQAVRLRGQLDPGTLGRAFDRIVGRHEALRTTFPAVGGRPVQVIAATLALPKPLVDLAGLPPGWREAEALRLAAADALASFDLARGPLLKMTLLRLGIAEHLLLLNTHHIVSDLWSIGVFLRELAALYGDRAMGRKALPALPVQYADYAVWQRERLRGEVLEDLHTFWRDRLGGLRPPLQLPVDRSRPAVQSFRGAEVPMILGPETSRAVVSLARGAGASLFMILLAAFKALVYRLSGEGDLAVGTFVANRTRAEVEPLIGFFVNTLVLRSAPTPELSFRAYLTAVREVALDAFAHQDLPFEELLAELQPERSLRHTPFFQVMFVFQNPPGLESRLEGLELERLPVATRRSNFDLTLWVWEGKDGLEATLHYSTDLLERTTAQRWAGYFQVLLAGAAAAPEELLTGLPVLAQSERTQILGQWSRTPGSFRREVRLHELFAEQAARTPDAPAVACSGQVATYAELARRMGRLACTLTALNVGPEVRVGLCVERTPELAVGLLAILAAGGTLVPLDPAYPPERQAFLLADSGAAVLLTQGHLAANLPAGGARLVLLDGPEEVVPAPADIGQRVPAAAAAWLIYTSGSTGHPKGVVVSHANAAPLLLWSMEYFGLGPDTRVLESLSYAFDFGVLEILTTLLAGGLLHLPGSEFGDPRRWAASALDRGIDTVHATPSFFREVAATGARLPAVRILHLGGEALYRGQAERYLEAVGGGAVLYNGYGPTEVTVNSLIYAARRPPGSWASGEAVPIGRPSAENAVYVLDRAGEMVPPGVAGELFLGGPGVARGYHGRPDRTAERFVPDPWSGEPGARLYCSGDLVRWLPDGNVEFLGRTDHQVKVRGFRIELGEIEAALAHHPGVGEAVVVAREDAPGDRRLVAYVVGAGGEAPSARSLREFLAGSLPGYMVPSAFVALDAFPVTPSGKLDRRALPAPASRPELDGYVAPRTPIEELVVGIWAEVLGVERVGVHDNFFELGGHSLVATQIVSRLHEACAVEVPLRALFEGPTVAELAERVESADASEVPPLRAVPRDRDLPLSFSQERIWFLAQLDPESAAYHVPRAVWIMGQLNAPALARAYGALLVRHEILRTTFPGVDGQPVQRIHEAAPLAAFVLPLIDLRELSLPVRQRELERLIVDDGRRRFDLARGPLLRASLARSRDEEHVVIQTEHHLVHDGWAEAVLLGDLLEFYGAFHQGRAPRLPDLPIQFVDFACWQREWLRGEIFERQLAYWRAHLAGAPPLLELPTDRPRPAVLSAHGGAHEVIFPAALVRDLARLGRRQGVTLFMSMLAGFAALLGRLSGQEDVVTGTGIANRRRFETEGMLGMIINTLPLRTNLSGSPGVEELLRRVRETCLGAYAHQDVPFDRIVEVLQPHRSLSHTPLFQVLFAFHDARMPEIDLPGITVRPGELHNRSAKFDLTLIVRPLLEFARVEGGGLAIHTEYSADLFDAPAPRRLLEQLEVVLGAMATAGFELRLEDLPLLSESARAQLLVEWNDTRRPYPSNLSIHSIFAKQAAASPDAIALVHDEQGMTYGELDARAERLAEHLRDWGVGPEVPVPFCLRRSPEMVVAILAILKAGGAYVPLDPDHPAERLAFLLADSGGKVVLTEERLLARLPPLPPEGRTICLDQGEWPIAQRGPGPSPCEVGAENLAYIMYTSGSTGRPKGVAVVHRGVVRLVKEGGYAELGPGDVLLQFAPVSFDASTLEIWGALLNGGRVVLFPGTGASSHELGDRILRHGVTTLWLTAGLFHQMAEDGLGSLRSLRQLLAGGDVLSPLHVRRALAELRGTLLVNGYGPTESTTFACCQRLTDPSQVARSVPIGRPIGNTRAAVLDRRLQPVPIGAMGELYLGGDGLARGYVGRLDLTAERFVPDPYGADLGGRLYRTGDLARYRPDGALEFLGRFDQQVKVRGFRIELGEVEAALATHPEVAENVVGVRSEMGEDGRLVAYVVPRSASLSPAHLRGFLRPRLPEAMIPSTFVLLDGLPLTANGKVDRRALSRLDRQPAGPSVKMGQPQTPTEELLASMWRELLGIEACAVGESFFELGGHSLLAMRLLSRIRAVFELELPLQLVFEMPPISSLAREIEGRSVGEGSTEATPIEPVLRGKHLPLSFAQERLWFLDRLVPGSPVYNIPILVRLRGRLSWPALAASLTEVAARHESLRTTFSTMEESPVQVIAPALRLAPPVVDLAGLPSERREPEARRLLEREAVRPFDLARGPLARALLLRIEEEIHCALFNLHHIVADGWSMGVLLGELGALYRAFASGEPSPLPALPVQYADYATWQRRWLAGDRLARQLAYWRDQLSAAPAVLDLPLDRARPAVQRFRGAQLPVRFSAEVQAGLSGLQRVGGATLFMVLMAGFQALLSRLTGQEDLVVGSPIAGRQYLEVEGLIGFFVNTLPLRARLAGPPSFLALLARTRQATLGAYAHQDLPFERLVEELAPERSLAHAPLFQVMLALQNAPLPAGAFGDLTLETMEVDPGIAKFDLTLSLAETAGRIAGGLEYDRDLFDRTTAQRLLGHLSSLLAAATAAPEQPIAALPLLSPGERAQLLWEWNDTAEEIPFVPVHELLRRQALLRPEALAVDAPRGRLLYGELDAAANRLAERLRALGVEREVTVAVLLEASVERVVAIAAVLKAGGAYVPLDPGSPPERLAAVLAEAEVRAILTTRPLAMGLPDTVAAVLDLEESEVWAVGAVAPPAVAVVPGDLAYVIFTSGSTGRPKGVELTHGGLANLVAWYDSVYEPTAVDRASLVGNAAFDLSVLELWVHLAHGASLHVPTEEERLSAEDLLRFLAAREITLSFLPTPLAEAVLEVAPRLGPALSLRALQTGGDRLHRGPDPLAGFPLINHYGPTEYTVLCTAAILSGAAGGAGGLPPIGRPIFNTRLAILDAAGKPVPIGVPGDLHLGGMGLARGYRGQPALTAERFVPDPWASSHGTLGARLYRTGDLVRWRPDGQLDFLGRLDQQVKIRGYRIELGDVEAALVRHPGVESAAALVRDDLPSGRGLVAYVVPVAGAQPAGLRSWLQERLPTPMVPAAFLWLEALPRTPNGKVDRRALAGLPPPDLDSMAARSGARLEPQNELQSTIAAVWREVLGLERIGIHDNFFDLGGHSLLLAKVNAVLKEKLGRDIPLMAHLQYPTVCALAEYLGKGPEGDEVSSLARPVERARGRKSTMGRQRQLRQQKRSRIDG